MMRFEPRLHIDSETAGLIESTTLPLLESPTVIVTDAYPFPLAAEIIGDEVQVRAAIWEELTAFLTRGDVPSPDDFEWLGDLGLPAGREIKWRETQDSEVQTDRGCHFVSGEVILKSDSGTPSPFYVHAQAARSFEFSTALAVPEHNICKLQVALYVCVRRFTPALIQAGDREFKRINQFSFLPVRGRGPEERFPPRRAHQPPYWRRWVEFQVMSLTSYRDKLLIKLLNSSFPFIYGLETGLKTRGPSLQSLRRPEKIPL